MHKIGKYVKSYEVAYNTVGVALGQPACCPWVRPLTKADKDIRRKTLYQTHGWLSERWVVKSETIII